MAKDSTPIPRGSHCFRILQQEGVVWIIEPCKYWQIDLNKPMEKRGYCAFLELGDDMEFGTANLWDGIKACGENLDEVPTTENPPQVCKVP